VHYLDFRGLRAAYRTWGQGAPLVLLHGGGASSALWTKVAETLGDDRRLIAPDLLGCGETASWPERDVLTHDLQAELVAHVLGEAGAGMTDVVGHSYGGATAVRLAINRPDRVRSLVLIEPILTCLLREAHDPSYEESVRVNKFFVASVDADRPEDAWREFLDARNGVGTWDRLSGRRRQEFLAQSVPAREASLSNLNNRTTLAECAALRVPLTIVCGAATTPADRRTSEVLRDAASGAHYKIIVGAGHMSPLSHPQEIARLVRGHLARTA
jgi:pimeloyl-ACP methyl ester carboxylesterase